MSAVPSLVELVSLAIAHQLCADKVLNVRSSPFTADSTCDEAQNEGQPGASTSGSSPTLGACLPAELCWQIIQGHLAKRRTLNDALLR